jgi:hypothetical protein
MSFGGIFGPRFACRVVIVPTIFFVVIVYELFFGVGKAYAPAPLRDLQEPQRTQIVTTLDTPIESEKNAVWCASFVAAWKRLQNDLAGGTVELDGAEELWKSLDLAPDPKNDEPPNSMYAVAGRFEDNIIGKIQAAVASQFPNSPPPTLPNLAPGDLLAYARLEVAAKFPIPYFDLPLNWTDGSGKSISVKGFGIEEHGIPTFARSRAFFLAAGSVRWSSRLI